MWQSWLMKRVIDNTSVRLLENYCLYSRNKQAVCTLCIDSCPTKALSFKNEKVVLDQGKCDDCNLCVHHCPTDALYLEREALYQYEKKIATREHVCFTCKKQSNTNDDVIIPCLSSLSPELVLFAIMHKKSVQIYYDSTVCRTCPLNYNVEKFIDWLQELDYIAYGDVHIINDIDEKKSKKKDITRRELFSFSKNKTKEEVSTLILDSYDKTLTVKNKLPLPERRKYLTEFIKREEKEKFLSLNLAAGLKVTKITVEEDCDLCGICTHLCPSGALKLEDNDNFLTLSFQAIQCINCEICSNNCSYIKRSIDTCLSKQLLLPKEIKSARAKECPKCGNNMIAHLHVCRECSDIENKYIQLMLE